MDRKRFRWNQRLALVRHNLHLASLTRDFGFFKCLQAIGLIEATDHVSQLTAILGQDNDAADSLMLSLDKFNTVIACVHEDAFKAVYDKVRPNADDAARSEGDRRTILHSVLEAQRHIANESIDKMFNTATDSICQQPKHAQEAAGGIFIMGSTFTAAAIEVCLTHLDKIEGCLDDPVQLDALRDTVEGAVAIAISGMKGVFKLMADTENGAEQEGRFTPPESAGIYAKNMFRRMSSVFNLPSYAASNASSTSSERSPTHHFRKGSTTSFMSTHSQNEAGSRKASISSIASPSARSRGLSNASQHNASNPRSGAWQLPGFSYRNFASTMSPIPATPASYGKSNNNADTDTKSEMNPFDAVFNNDVAFASNRGTCHTATHPDIQSASTMAQHTRSRSHYDDEDVAPHAAFKRLSGEMSLSHVEEGEPCDLVEPCASSFSGLRRRSTNVTRESQPTLQGLTHIDEVV